MAKHRRASFVEIEEGDENTISGYFNTSYITKLAQGYLHAVIDCKDNEPSKDRVLPVRGGQTLTLRKKRNLDGLEYDLMGWDLIFL